MAATVATVAYLGLEARAVEVQVQLSSGVPKFTIVGLPDSAVSWGNDISSAQTVIRTAPHVLFFPSAMLSLTVLAFIMLGDAVRDALDPKMR